MGTPRAFISRAISTGAALRPEFEMKIAAFLCFYGVRLFQDDGLIV